MCDASLISSATETAGVTACEENAGSLARSVSLSPPRCISFLCRLLSPSPLSSLLHHPASSLFLFCFIREKKN
ncbi:hypothetical protein Zm00014a_044480 [Zea mays]|uniref:Uncharacterized protein n=1 Tax=Zea mays TaxID=4577 RepID=A0A3L6FKS4_MAIZE|nr:hypothetical protein Zm00014a_044480 [Zea mays]